MRLDSAMITAVLDEFLRWLYFAPVPTLTIISGLCVGIAALAYQLGQSAGNRTEKNRP